ncbi:hypothetical protein [Streptomyces sp. SCL15-4]|uniref:hypothetical protein n=1 Tax=Streptomyces sp. SCL15-4 TaxID=2967221 RepID=UPI002965DCB7|nr:hypothetical protein [Streptomyces sp. SCL15-4]
MTRQRYTADTITDDALDELYETANHGWRRGDEWKDRALKAEAALERLTKWCDELDTYARVVLKDDSAENPVAANIRARIAEPKETSTP